MTSRKRSPRAGVSVPVCVIIGGINGCGKSTFAAGVAAEHPALFLGQTAVNPDALTREVRSDHPKISLVGANLVAVERAEKAAWRAIAQGDSIAIETVLSSEKFLPLVRAARHRGYRTRLIFVGVPTVDVALARIAQRVRSGGHDVPEKKVRARWERTHDNLARFLLAVDDVFVFANLDAGAPILVAERLGLTRPMALYDTTALPAVTARVLLSPS